MSALTLNRNRLDSKICYKEHKGRKIKYKIIDTDADKSKEFIRKGNNALNINIVYYDMSNAIIILYDITNQASFDDVHFWLNSVKQQCTHNPRILMVGNKADVNEKRAVSSMLAARYAAENGIDFFEISAHDVTSMDKLLNYITTAVLDPPPKPEHMVSDTRIEGDETFMRCSLA